MQPNRAMVTPHPDNGARRKKDTMKNTDTAAPAPDTTAQLDNVAFGFAEGTLSVDGAKAHTWKAAEALLSAIQAANAPKPALTYTKVDVVVTWDDGETYAFRYDVDAAPINLGQRVVDGARWLANFHRETGRGSVSAEDVEAFLTNRDFNGAN